MDNNQLLDELKQYLDGRLSQTEERLRQDVTQEISTLRSDMNDGFAGIGEIVSGSSDIIDILEERISKLEDQPA